MTENDKVWAAGFFEGEGTVGISKLTAKSLGQLTVGITNTDKECLNFFRKRWKGGIYPVPATKATRKPGWRWIVSSKQAVPFLEDIQPFIHRSRVRKKICLALSFQKQKKRPTLTQRARYRKRQASFYMKLRGLNHRGSVTLRLTKHS